MSAFAVIVDFRLKPGMRGAFRTLVDANARASAKTEADCLRFDVLEPDEQPDSILLYEVYADRGAFQTHIDSAHYRSFAAETEGLCDSKTVITCDLVCEGGA